VISLHISYVSISSSLSYSSDSRLLQAHLSLLPSVHQLNPSFEPSSIQIMRSKIFAILHRSSFHADMRMLSPPPTSSIQPVLHPNTNISSSSSRQHKSPHRIRIQNLPLLIVVCIRIRSVCLDNIRQRDLTTGFVQPDVHAVLVLDTEDDPQHAAEDLDEGDDKRRNARVLRVFGEDDVGDPGHAQDGVGDHGGVVDPFGVEGEDVAEVFRGLLLGEAEVHVDIPPCCCFFC